MAKKKEYDADDPETWSDAQMNKYIIDSVKEIGIAMPWNTIALSAVFIYGHWKAWGSGPMPTMGDILLGVMYALTIPPALQGGVVANSYAVGILGYMGVGMIPGSEQWKDQIEDTLEGAEGGALGFLIAGLPGLVLGWKLDLETDLI